MSRHGTPAPERAADGFRGSTAPAAAGSGWDLTMPAAPRGGHGGGRGGGIVAWPLRRKLIALVAIPLSVVLVASGVAVFQTVQDLRQAQRARELATIVQDVNASSDALQRERTASLEYLRTASDAALGRLEAPRGETDLALGALLDRLEGSSAREWSRDIGSATDRVDEATERLGSLRAGTQPGRSPEVLISSFAPIFDAVSTLARAVSDQLQDESSDTETAEGAALLAALMQVSAAAAAEQDVLTLALQQNEISLLKYSQLSDLAATQREQLVIADRSATPAQSARLTVAVSQDSRLDIFRRDVTTLLVDGDEVTPGTPEAFSGAAAGRLDALGSLVSDIASQVRDDAGAAVTQAVLRAALAAGGALLTLLLVSLVTVRIGRSVTEPLKALRAGAADVANVQLPAAVRRIEAEGPDAPVYVPPVLARGAKAGPETVEVATAVDGLTTTAVQLAGSQVRLRRALDDAFVNMSRRSQSMVEKQLAIIDELESTEQDPDQLRNLFRLDHLAARMRRYNDNLLVLAGSTLRTRSNAPVPVAELFRAATSEMEQYERVRLEPVAGAAISGPAAGGLVHLLAELLDNAAMFSPPTSPILLSAAFTADGGLTVEVVDSGVGIPAQELQRINTRLAEPEDVASTVPSRMGLFVVGRLARRGGYRVRLNQRDGIPGVIAQVSVPAKVVMGSPGHTGELPVVPATASPVAAPAPAQAAATMPARPPVQAQPSQAEVTWTTVAGDGTSSDLPRRVRAQTIPAPGGPGFGTPDPATAASLFGTTPPVVQPAALSPLDAAASGHTGHLKAVTNATSPTSGDALGQAPTAWDDALPTELAARAAATARSAAYQPTTSDLPMIGDDVLPGDDATTPIFDSISVWFADEPTPPATAERPGNGVAETGPGETGPGVIDLREPAAGRSQRWASLGDQEWIAASIRASAAPDTAGQTETGLPRRRPGANLIPTSVASGRAAGPAASPAPGAPPAVAPASAQRPPSGSSDGLPSRGAAGPAGVTSAAPEIAPRRQSVDAEAVRGRLGSYQRGLSSARQARRQAIAAGSEITAGGLFGAATGTQDPPAGSTGDEEGAK